MLFRSRNSPGTWERTRIALWPRRSFARSLQYFAKRVLRLTATPHAIAAGVAAGVFSSFTPPDRLSFLLAFIIAYLIAGNLVAATVGTMAGNPLTFPLIWASTYELGAFLIGLEQPHGGLQAINLSLLFANLDVRTFWSLLWEPLLKPMLIGAIPIGLAFAIPVYILTYVAVSTFRRQRERRIMRKNRKASTEQPAGG